jgi:hypothetical protein
LRCAKAENAWPRAGHFFVAPHAFLRAAIVNEILIRAVPSRRSLTITVKK